MNKYELNAVLKISNDKRFKYFINKVADNGFLYGLGYENGDLETFDVKGRIYVPLWSHSEFAVSYMKEVQNLDDLNIIKIDISTFEKEYQKGFDKNNVEFFDVFPINKLTANIVKITLLYEMLQDEIDRFL